MIRYPMVVPGSHPASATLFDADVYVETRLTGPTVGFAAIRDGLWVDMPVDRVGLLDDKALNPQYQYVGVLTEHSLTLTDILTRKGPLDHEAKFVEADRLGFECVQLLYAGALSEPQQIHDFLQQSPDGLVVKPITPPQGPLFYAEITAEMFGPPSEGDPSCQTSSLES